MDKNVFIKDKKYNPDIVMNYSKKLNERSDTKFEFKNEFLNDCGISKDFNEFKVDQPSSEIDKLIQKKMSERENQEFQFKPEKNYVASSNPGDFKEYNDLKNQQVTHETKNVNRNNNFNDILSDLQDLGILKK